MAVLDGCEGAKKTPVLQEVKCPVCGETVEVFTKECILVEDSKCEKCGHVFKAGEHI
ncbi:MAG: hypothetical protein ACI4ET_13785 [Bilifractor sp.]